MSKKSVLDCIVMENIRLSNDVFKMTVMAKEICLNAQPGQFVQVKTGRIDSPLLRRPISIADVQDDKLTIIYRTVGEGTRWLAQCKTNDIVNIMGPLGRGFDLTTEKPLLTGGGIGIAPMIYLARILQPKSPSLLLAARCKEDVIFWHELFSNHCKNIHITTDDGSIGTKGNIMALLPKLCEQEKFDHLYTCGPTPMLHAIADFAKKQIFPCQLSLESRMACGTGTCLACSCNATSGNRVKICQNGPVFNVGEVEGL